MKRIIAVVRQTGQSILVGRLAISSRDLNG
jgi:hypothetical protein